MRLLTRFRTPLLVAGLVAGFWAPMLVVPSPVSAIDIFKTCTEQSLTADQKAKCNDCASAVASQSDYCKEAATATGNPIIHIVTIIINIISFVAGAAAIIGLIVSGLRLILSNGDSNSVATARNGILYSLIGIAIVVLAQGIVVFILNKIK